MAAGKTIKCYDKICIQKSICTFDTLSACDTFTCNTVFLLEYFFQDLKPHII